MRGLTVVYDACVLYPAPLRDLLMRLSLEGLYRARWTDAIHDEWIRNAVANGEITNANAARVRALIDQHVEGCLVTGYEELIDGIVLPDPDDRHVVAAAVTASADLILTFNLRDFPPEALRRFDVEAQHPDPFVACLIGEDPETVCAAVKRQRANLKRPPRSADELLHTFVLQGLPLTSAALRAYVELL